jgi:hypothetical protein
MFIEFACVFGISNSVPGAQDGEAYSLYCSHAAVIVFPSMGHRLVWVVAGHLGKALPFAETPRYTDDFPSTTERD